MTLELVYTDYYWDSDDPLAALMRQIDWHAIRRTVETYTRLGSLRVGVARKQHPKRQKCAALVGNASACAAVLDGLSGRLRAITTFF